MVDVRKFIGEIKQRRALWDIRHPTYHDKYKLYCGWREISEMFNISVPAAKQKWKNLRDTFRVEVKKQLKRATEELPEGVKREPYQPMWQHYDDMVFLKDLLKTRRDVIDQEKMFEQFQNGSFDVTGESSNDNTTDPDIKVEYSELIPTLNELDGLSQGEGDDEGDVSFDRRAFHAFAEERKNNKRKRQEEIADQDDDLLFFRSLIPYVKRLPDDKRLIFRTSVQQMLYNELYTD